MTENEKWCASERKREVEGEEKEKQERGEKDGQEN